MTPSRRTGRRSAFTLIELLVVLGIIGILVALLFPVVNTAMERGRREACKNNLKQLNEVFHNWANDHNGDYPLIKARPVDQYGNWTAMNGQSPLYLHARMLGTNGYLTDTRIWVCPSDKVDGPGNNLRVYPAADVKSILSFNISYMYVAGHRIIGSRESQPAKAPVIADEANQIENGAATPGNMKPILSVDNHGKEYRNVLFLDGHVEGLKGNNVANSIFNYLSYSMYLQSVD